MAKNQRKARLIVVDTNIIIDLLHNREPFVEDARNLFIGMFNGEYRLCISANTVTDIYYYLQKTLSAEEAREAIRRLLALVPVMDTTGEDCQAASICEMQDFEDAVLAMAAKRIKADFIVTRNVDDFKNSPVPAMYPGEFLLMIDNGK